MQLDAHLGVAAGGGNDRRQLAAGHGVGGGDAQHPAGGQLIPEGKLTNLLHLGHHSLASSITCSPMGSGPPGSVALAGKQRQPQLLFQHLHLLAEGRLGGIELLRRRRDVEVVLHYLGEVLEPGDVHQGARRSMPAVPLAGVIEAIVQTMLPALPELDGVDAHPETTPEARQRHSPLANFCLSSRNLASSTPRAEMRVDCLETQAAIWLSLGRLWKYFITSKVGHLLHPTGHVPVCPGCARGRAG